MISALNVDFNPHSHEGSDVMTSPSFHVFFISIHTPMKGVTIIAPHLLINKSISIHTPMKGVTLSANIKKRFIRISIHTPMKGVT